MLIDLEQLSTPQVYFTMTQAVMPRPVAWVLSENKNGSYNLAPFSYFNAVSSDPPLVIISIGLQDDGTLKDTLANVMDRPELVIHIASCDQLPDLNLSSATLPPGESEVAAGNLETTAVEDFHLPRLTQSKIAFMSRIHKIEKIGNNNQHIVFAEIRKIYVADEATEINEKGRLQIKADVVEPLARLGASQYASFGEILVAKRPA
jgi:flavin reductase (DIM6/NTAB) family NADH-FMN oxidoreductase RutF